MCGIAGVVDLNGQRPIPGRVLQAMADAILHRGPDEEGFFQQNGLGLANRRLSIVGLFDGQQPIYNEDKSVAVVFNGEFFDYPERKAELESRGHQFRTHCDTELIPHLWEDLGEGLFDKLHGQFAFALFDSRQRRLILGRDRFGICPLYWSRQGDWLLFGSEIKALLASGMVSVRPDPRGINHAFTFFALPGPVTCFEGVSALMPGHFLDITLPGNGKSATLRDKTYWHMDFPDQGQEDYSDPKKLTDQFEAVLLSAVERRLRADVPVVSYLSGGVDSSLVVAMASKVRGSPIPTFTIQIDDPYLDETNEAAVTARHVGSKPTVVHFGRDEVLNTYPRLVAAAESPVIDTSCAALLLLAQEVHRKGIKVALTGEGADEWLAGYPWYKVNKLLGYLDVVPGLRLSTAMRGLFLRLTGQPRFPKDKIRQVQDLVGGHNGWLDIYGMMSMSKLRFFSPEMRQIMVDNVPYADLGLPTETIRRWHPLNRALYLGARIHLPGLLLNAKGDRVAMHNSLETRYPFLDEKVFTFLANVAPKWKMKGFKDKYLLRVLAERYLPKEVAWRRKAMFRAPLDSFHMENPPAYVGELFSEESLRKTGYFDPAAVAHWRQAFRDMRAHSTQRYSVEMGLSGVLSTQLWHHLYIDPTLADLPGLTLTPPGVRTEIQRAAV